MKDGAAMRRTIRKACTGTKNILVIAAAVFAVCGHSSGYTQAAEIQVPQTGGGLEAAESGAESFGWQKADGAQYYISPDTGELQTGWQEIEGGQYYFSPETGKLQTGWQEIEGDRYYFKPETGRLQTGWQEIDGKKYYFSKKTGQMQTGRQKIGGKKAYYFNDSGVLKTSGWIRDGKKVYYAKTDGVLCSGWKKADGRQYYFSPENSRMKTGWQKIGGKYYFFTVSEEEKGVLKKNCIAGTKKSGYYYVGRDGVRADSFEVNAAVQYVRSHTKAGWTASRKLEACYQSLRNDYTYRHYHGVPTGAELSGCAYSLFDSGRGNCYRYASGMACIAAVLGYPVRVATGKVTSVYGGFAEHGWAQVWDEGKWKLCDVGMKQFMTQRHPVRSYVASAVYRLTIKNGKTAWVQQADENSTAA